MSAIAYCHSRGVMHRDLKPQNILIVFKSFNHYGVGGISIKVADFGLARSREAIDRGGYSPEVITSFIFFFWVFLIFPIIFISLYIFESQYLFSVSFLYYCRW